MYLYIASTVLIDQIDTMPSLVTTDRSQTKIRAQILNEEKTVSCDKEFLFDAHYGPMSTQSEIYQRPAALVESVLNGCNATIFAYGQVTGASYTPPQYYITCHRYSHTLHSPR